MDSVILIIILIALVEASFKHVDIFNEFIEGVKEGSKLLITLFPTMMAFTLWVTCFQYCGLIELLEIGFAILNIPIDIFMMMIVRPFSSNGSLTILNNIFLKYGVDHPYSILGSIIQTGSDTTFYVVTLYFGSIKLQNNRYALKLGLWLDAIACLLATIAYLLFIG